MQHLLVSLERLFFFGILTVINGPGIL